MGHNQSLSVEELAEAKASSTCTGFLFHIHQTKLNAVQNSHHKFPVTEKELKRLHRRFRKLDTDNSGTLTLNEFQAVPGLVRRV